MLPLCTTISPQPKFLFYKYPNYQGFVNVTDKIFEIPEYCMEEYVNLNLNLEKPRFDYVKLLDKSLFGDVEEYNQMEKDINNDLWQFNASYVHLRNIYCSGTGSFCTDNMSVIHLDEGNETYWIREFQNGPVIGNYISVIAVTHRGIRCFGHFLGDVLVPLMLFPEELLHNSTILVFKKGICYSEYFKCVGISPLQVIYPNLNDWIFCDHFYTPVDPMVFLAHFGQLTRKFSMKLRSYFKLDEITPTKYFLTNRAPRQFRYIKNMKKILEKFKELYPERGFTMLQDYHDLKTSSIQFGSAKLIFGPTGSNLFKHFAMPNKSILIVIASDIVDRTLCIGAATHEIFVLFIRLPGMLQHIKTNNVLNEDEAIRAINIGLYCVDHGYFNPAENFTQ